MPVTIVDLVSDNSDEESHGDVVDEGLSANFGVGNAGKRKIEISKREPNRKNPWFRNATFETADSQSKVTLAQRVSPALEEQKGDDDDYVDLLFKPNLFPANLSKSATVRSAFSSPGPKVESFPPPQVWWDSDNAIITSGVLPLLRAKSSSVGSLLMSNVTSVPHIQQMDEWSCGFRNIQMLLAALVPLLSATHPFFQALMYIYCQEVPHHLLGESSLLILPSLTQLQQQLEACWRDGFDPNGADHFKHSVVGRRSRIGAVEVSFVLTYWWLDSCVVQFIKCFQSRRLLPPFVYHYFRGCSGDQQARKKAMNCLKSADEGTSLKLASGSNRKPGRETVLPMYLQWEGHSVTVVGIESPVSATTGDIGKTNWSQWNLLVFCPARNCSRLMPSNISVPPFRLPCHQLLQKDCQLVLSSWEPLSPQERDLRKFTAPVVTAASDVVMDYVARGL